MAIRRKQIFCGRVVHSKSLTELEIIDNAALGVAEDGTISFIDKDVSSIAEAQSKYPSFSEAKCTKLEPLQFLFPGMIDTHLHAPQWPNLAIGMEGNLREWVEKYTDPIEASYKDSAKAQRVYDEMVQKELTLGTTSCAYNSSPHWEATNILADICKKYGQRAVIGKLCIIQGSTHGNWEKDVETSLADEKKSVDHIMSIDPHGHIVMPCIQPRGGPYVPPKGMMGLGHLSQKTYTSPSHTKPIRVQAHMCETPDDISRTLKLHPNHSTYTEMYHANGLLHSRSILAHCIHLTPSDIDMLVKTGAGVAHNPNSNTCLRDGWCRVRTLLDAGVKVGLGSDCSAGYSTSILDAMRSASNVSRHLVIATGDESYRLSFNEIVFLGTLGGAQVLDLADRVGNFEVGKQFDALLVDTGLKEDSINTAGWEGDADALVKKWVFMGDDRSIRRVWVGGRLVAGKDKSVEHAV